jgi:hypothetical protein
MKVICSRFDRCTRVPCLHRKLHEQTFDCATPQCKMFQTFTECLRPQLLDQEQQVKLTLREL